MAANLLIVDERIVSLMLNDRRFVNEFDCVRQAQAELDKAKTTCPPCRHGKGIPNQGQIIKNCQQGLINLPADKQRRLKILLDTEQVRIGIVNPRGAQVWYTF